MGKLAKVTCPGRSGQRWLRQTTIVNKVTTIHMPMSKSYVLGIPKVGETYQTLAEVSSSHELQESLSCTIPTKNSISAPTLVLEASASHTMPAVVRPRPSPASASPRLHCSCRWARRLDRGKSVPTYDRICNCKRDRQQRREKSFKQQTTGTSKSCLKKTCKRQERSVPSMPPATHTDAAVQLLYYKDKLTATEQLIQKKDEIIRLQNESLVLAEKRLATLTTARVELRRTHTPALTAPSAHTHTRAHKHPSACTHPSTCTHPSAHTAAASCTRASTCDENSTCRNRKCQGYPMESKQQQQTIVQTLQDNLSVMEELYRESFYEAAKQEDVIESLRLSCLELRDLEASKADEVGRLQHVVNTQQWTIGQCQEMATEVERLKSELHNFVNNSNNDSGVWEGEETSPPEFREDLQGITSQLLKLRDILTDDNSFGASETLKLKRTNMQLQNKISQLQLHITRLESTLAGPDNQCGSPSFAPYSPDSQTMRRRRVKSKSSMKPSTQSSTAAEGKKRTCSRCQLQKKQSVSAHASVHGVRSRSTTSHGHTDYAHLQDEQALNRSVSSQARVYNARGNSKSGENAEPLTMLQVQLTSAQERSAVLCQEARRALCRVRKWAVHMRMRLKEREAEIEVQKQEIEDLRNYINQLRESSESPPPESKVLSEQYALKKQILEGEEKQCRALRKEIEKFKVKSVIQNEDEDDDVNINNLCLEVEVMPELPRTSKVKQAYRPPPDNTELKNKCLQCRSPPQPREKEPKNMEPQLSFYEINPGEIAEVDTAGMKVLFKCRDCERRNIENREAHTQTIDQQDKLCNEELCLMPGKKKELKKPPSTNASPPSPALPCFRDPSSAAIPCSSKETIISKSNDSLRSFRFQMSPKMICCPKEECPAPGRQMSMISRTRDPVEVPIKLKCRPMCNTTSTIPVPSEPTQQQTKHPKKGKKKLRLPKLDITCSKKSIKEVKKQEDKRDERKKLCCCTGPCRCRCSTQAWKLEACSSPCSASSSASCDERRDHAASSVDSYHSLLMDHLKKKFPFLAHRWGRCEVSVQQPLRSDAGTSRSRPFEEVLGVDLKKTRPQSAPSKTSGSTISSL